MSPFSLDYATAKTRFIEAAEHVGAQLLSYPLEPASQTVDASLTIDVAILPGQRSEQVVVVSSGLHGVEGFFGSAVQLDWLQAIAAGMTPAFEGQLVLVHALNPFGFQYLRRGDADNVDLNRNFLLPDQPYTGLPDGYRELAPLLNPTGPPRRFDAFTLRALLAIGRHGLSQLKAVIATGQHEFPQGLFFGGAQVAAPTRIVQTHFKDWIGGAEHIVHIDLHSGLGRAGQAKLLLVDPPDSPDIAWYAHHFGEDAIEPLRPTGGIAYAARGLMGAWLRVEFRQRGYRSLVAEFGTHRLLRVFAALRAENQAFHGCQPDDPRLKRAQRELVECFCPAGARWRRQVLTRSAELIAAAQLAAGQPKSAVP